MFDTFFVRQIADFKKNLKKGEPPQDPLSYLENIRSPKPHVYQIETTNYCNLTCVMCPRTELMTRKLGHMEEEVYANIIAQLEPHPSKEWQNWLDYVEEDGLANSLAYSEDYFYYMICSKTVVMHGFGEPVMDKKLPERIRLATSKGLATYFSMNPVNIKLDVMDELGEAGLGFLKFSLDGLTNESQKKYRGRVDKTFEDTLNKITATIALFEEKNYPTQIVMTKLKFKEEDIENELFLKFWEKYNVFAYIKNQHNRWLYKEEDAPVNTAEYMTRFCEFPWSSVSILQDGSVVPCPLDYEGHMTMGNVKEASLEEIWNGESYTKFREMHVSGHFPEGHFCKTQCDIPILYEKLP
jgi:radical SAM protein with 4Fe4S-binding SPASM domain